MGCGNSKTHPESGLTSAFPAELEAKAKREAAEPKQEVEAEQRREADAKAQGAKLALLADGSFVAHAALALCPRGDPRALGAAAREVTSSEISAKSKNNANYMCI